MPKNKLKEKVESLTRVIQHLLKEVEANANLAQGTLTAFQLSIGENEWKKLVEELKDIESRSQPEEKKFENVE